MALLDLVLENIAERDLQRLIDTAASESLYIDYKRESYGRSDSDHAEYLADISSFANTSGGDLVIGMTEDRGIPTGFSGLSGDPDAEKRRLEEIARSGLEPRIRTLGFRGITLSDGLYVLIVRIPKSYSGPHRINFKNRNRFFARASSGKYEPNVEELRGLFTQATQLADSIRSFRIDRLVRIGAGEAPIALSRDTTKVVLHVVPSPSFADRRLMDVISSIAAGTHVPLPLRGPGGGNRQAVNLDGYVNHTVNMPGQQSYAQFFRSGVIEGVTELNQRKEDGDPYFVGPEFTQKVVGALRQYLSVLESYGTGLPVYAMLSLCNARRCRYRYVVEGTGGWNDTEPLGRDVVTLPEVLVENFSVDSPTVLRPLFNILWNAFGFLRCDMYNAEDRWKGT
jgi:hypothetical protein